MAAESISYMDDSLYKAAAKGETEKFNGIELESLQTPNRNNVLHVNLATERCIEFTQHMLNECPSLLLQANALGRTPLHIAARHGDSDIVKFLITFRLKRADEGDLEQQETALDAVRRMLRMKDLKSDTALHVAARYGHVGVVQELVEFEDPDYSYSVNKKQETPVYIAAEKGDGGLVSKILDNLKSTAHGGPKGRTALHAAAVRGNAGATRTILEKIGGNLTKETDENGQTPLHYAAHLGYVSVVEELLKWDKSAAYIADTKSQMTPLLMASRQGYLRTVRLILSCCPDCWEILDKRGWNFLHFLAFRGKVNFNFNVTRKKKFNLNDVKTEYGFDQDLFDDAEDESGITPKQVYLACYMTSHFSTSKRVKEKEQVMKLLEDIINEQVADKAVRGSLLIQSTKKMEKTEKMEKTREAHLIVATLIATVTFAAAVTVPGGYKSEKGADQGTPFLLHDAAFIVFVVSDALAFFCSMSAIMIHFRTRGIVYKFIKYASWWIVGALWALMTAFYTGLFAVLRPSLWFAISSLCLGLFFHLRMLLFDHNTSIYRKYL